MRTPYAQDSDFTLYQGDAVEVLRDLPDELVQCVVTSPPYWGLRDYGTGEWDGGADDCDHEPNRESPSSTLAGTTTHQGQGRPYLDRCEKCGALRVDRQLGLEATPEEYVARMVLVFREVRRVLRKDGVLWLNIGDTYNRNTGAGFNANKRHGDVDTVRAAGLPAKNLVGIPWRLAFALQADGWWLRSEVIWSKPNVMPESATDRPTRCHEQVFLFTKSARYFYDIDAVREPYLSRPQQRLTPTVEQPLGQAREDAGVQNGPQGGVQRFVPQEEALPGMVGEAPRGADGRRKTIVRGLNGSLQHRDGERWPAGGRNLRSVWDIVTEPTSDAHFATFPQALVARCINSGSREGDTVLDPFGGSGTTALVARRLSRRSVLIDLNPDYCELTLRRTAQLSLLAAV